MMKLRFVNALLLFSLVLVALSSCTSNKKLTDKAVYFKNISDSMLLNAAAVYEPVLQKGDILYIGVISTNEKSTRFFNAPNFYGGSDAPVGASNSGNSNPTQGYLIDEKGQITFPLLGRLNAAGMTKSMLRDSISNKLTQYVDDSAIVTIRLINYRITVLGEVNSPGAYSIPSERVTVLDAIGLAGDLTIYGRRDKIRIIRTQENGVKQTATLNINEGNIFDSPYFYLRQNDIVYVELNERKVPNTDQANIRNLSIIIGIVSAVSVIISTINVLK